MIPTSCHRPDSELPLRGRPCAARSSEQASSLLLVLWAIMLMSFAVIGLVNHLSRGLDESLEAGKVFRAHLLLESARTLSAHPDIERGDPLLRQAVSATSSYEVTQTTEGTRLAINQLATSPIQRRFARRLFEKWGLDSQQSETLTESIMDWIDADDRPRSHGAEKDFYTGLGHLDFPFNRPFQDLDDLLLVRGADELDHRKPNWRDYFTLYGERHHRPASGVRGNAHGAVRCHARRGRAVSADASRTGRLAPETEDDPRFLTLPEVRRLLDVPEPNYTRRGLAAHAGPSDQAGRMPGPRRPG